MEPTCYRCHLRTLEKLIAKFSPPDENAADLNTVVHKLLHENQNTSNPVIAARLHRISREKLRCADLYREEKKMANELLLQQESHWENIIQSSHDPFSTAARLAVIGNIIDYGAHSVSDDLKQQIESLFHQRLTINETKTLQERLNCARKVLYLGDNAGEIVFDKLFIKTINHSNLIYSVRGAPVINDITLEDTRVTGLDGYCEVISNGDDAPSTLLDCCSEEFLDIYKNADLIISKGQGNFEGLMNEKHPNTFFLLIAKCNPIASLLGISKGGMVVTQLP